MFQFAWLSNLYGVSEMHVQKMCSFCLYTGSWLCLTNIVCHFAGCFYGRRPQELLLLEFTMNRSHQVIVLQLLLGFWSCYLFILYPLGFNACGILLQLVF